MRGHLSSSLLTPFDKFEWLKRGAARFPAIVSCYATHRNKNFLRLICRVQYSRDCDAIRQIWKPYFRARTSVSFSLSSACCAVLNSIATRTKITTTKPDANSASDCARRRLIALELFAARVRCTPPARAVDDDDALNDSGAREPVAETIDVNCRCK